MVIGNLLSTHSKLLYDEIIYTVVLAISIADKYKKSSTTRT